MILELVLFKSPAGMDRAAILEDAKHTVAHWRANPDLVRKTFLFDETSRRGGAVYNWKNIEAAKLGHGPEFQKRIQATFGSQPEFQYFETPIIIDNTTNQVIDEAA